jgi:hypothetical protein
MSPQMPVEFQDREIHIVENNGDNITLFIKANKMSGFLILKKLKKQWRIFRKITLNT